MLSRGDHLSLLELQPTATLADIKKNYRILALKMHPDKGGDKIKWAKLHDAYQALTKADDSTNIETAEEKQFADLQDKEADIIAELREHEKAWKAGLELARNKRAIESKFQILRYQLSSAQHEEKRYKEDIAAIETEIAEYQKQISRFTTEEAKAYKESIDSIIQKINQLELMKKKILNDYKKRLDQEINRGIFDWGLKWFRWLGDFSKTLQEYEKDNRPVEFQWNMIKHHVKIDPKSRGAKVWQPEEDQKMVVIEMQLSTYKKILDIKKGIKRKEKELNDKKPLLTEASTKIKELDPQIDTQEELLKSINYATGNALTEVIEDRKRELDEVRAKRILLQKKVEEKKVIAFIKIYKALFAGQSKWLKKAPLLDRLAKGEKLTADKIRHHIANKDKNDRSCFAWELAQQETHYKNCNLNNTALVTAIYKWAKEHTPIARSRDSFSYLFESQTKGSLLAKFFPCFFKPSKETNDSKDAPQQVLFKAEDIQSGKMQKNSRLAKIADVFDYELRRFC